MMNVRIIIFFYMSRITKSITQKRANRRFCTACRDEENTVFYNWWMRYFAKD